MHKNLKRFVSLATALSLLPAIPAFALDATNSRPESALLDSSQMDIIDESIGFLEYNYTRDASILFDSQELLPSTPIVIKDKIEGKTWYPHAKKEYGQAILHIDLGAYYMITDIGYMDMNGSPSVTLWKGEPFSWQYLGELLTNNYNNFRVSNFEEPTPTRYIRIVCDSTDSGINELGLYGYKVSDLTDEDLEKTGIEKDSRNQSKLTAGKKIGANAFCDDPYVALAALGNIREYSNWSWMTHADGTHTFSNIVNKDNYYKTLKQMNIDVIPCVQMTCESFLDEDEVWDKIKNTIPVERDADTLNPISYSLHSNAMYNFAARYGNNDNIDKTTLNVREGEKVKVGLNYLDTVESWNEQDKTWETKESYFTPYEYAAMLSADYDGHEGAIENGGVKTADDNFRLAMGGLVSNGKKATMYLDLMKEWFDFNRTDGKFAADVINYHDYISDSESPEYSDFRDNIREIVQWRDNNAPGRDIWCSEFDVYTNDLKVSGIDNHENEDFSKGRADRLLRAFLIGDREGLDRLSMFMLRDEWWGVYADSGLTTGKGDWDKKDSWYYVSTATDTLKNADLVDWYESDDLYIYTYEDRDNSETIYAMWSPTVDGSKISNYELYVGNKDKATLVYPYFGIMEGKKETLEINNGIVNIDVSETVQFIKVSNDDVDYDSYPQRRIDVQQLRLGELNGTPDTLTFDNSEVINISDGEMPSDNNFMLNQFYHLFDEQNTAPETPWLKCDQIPETKFDKVAVKSEQSYPYDAVITLDDFYDITYIGIYDTYNTGKLEIYDATTDQLIYRSELDSYNNWVLSPMTDKIISTNCIRIVKYNSAELNEIAFYGYKSNSTVGNESQPIMGEIGEAKSKGYEKLNPSNIELGEISLSAPKNQSGILTAFDNLFDESYKTPANTLTALEKGTSFSTYFSKVWNTGTDCPYDAIVNFESSSEITTVGIFLGYGEKTGQLKIYNNETNELIFDKILEGTGKWVFIELDSPIETSSLKIEKCDNRTISEMQFYGNKI